jgi:hypothetical protein
MAQLKNPIMGDASGKAGSIVFTHRGNSSFFGKKPRKNKKPPTQKTLAIRNKFALTVKVATGINSIALLKNMWPENCSLRQTRFNAIFQHNYKRLHSIDDLNMPALIPSNGFPLKNGLITITQTGFTFAADAFGPEALIDPAIEKFYVGAGVIMMSGPVTEGAPELLVKGIKTGQTSLDSDVPISIAVDFNGIDETDFKAYTVKKIALQLVTLDQTGSAVRSSITVMN